MAKSGRLELENNIYGYYKSIFNHCDVFGQQSNRIRWKTQKKAKSLRSRLFKVIEVATNRKPVCDFLLVINNWQPISYRFEVIAAYCSNFGHCVLSHPLGGLETMYDVHLGLIGKRVVDFLLVIIELFMLDVMAEALRAKIGDFAPTRLVWLKTSGRMGCPPTNDFCMDS